MKFFACKLSAQRKLLFGNIPVGMNVKFVDKTLKTSEKAAEQIVFDVYLESQPLQLSYYARRLVNKIPDYLESSRIIKHGIIMTQILVN